MSWFQNISTWAKNFELKWAIECRSENSINFSDFAFDQLQNQNFHSKFRLIDVIQEILNFDIYPSQFNPFSNFGEPPITLYISTKYQFILEMYVWKEVHTTIHDHSFDGAFTLLQGQSVEVEYDFFPEYDLGPSKIGNLKKKSIQFLTQGCIRKIRQGNKFIHKVIHISKPTVSLVLRNYRHINDAKQFDYHFNIIGSPSFPEKDVIGKLRVVTWYLENNQKLSEKIINDLLPYSQFWQLLASNPNTKTLIRKLAYIINKPSLIRSMNSENIFLRLLKLLENDDDKICFSFLEYFESPNLDELLEQINKLQFSSLPSININSFRENLKNIILSESVILDNSFLENIFN